MGCSKSAFTKPFFFEFSLLSSGFPSSFLRITRRKMDNKLVENAIVMELEIDRKLFENGIENGIK